MRVQAGPWHRRWLARRRDGNVIYRASDLKVGLFKQDGAHWRRVAQVDRASASVLLEVVLCRSRAGPAKCAPIGSDRPRSSRAA